MKRTLVTFLVALFATVVLGQTKTEMGPNEVPDCVTKYITVNMPGYTIDKAVKVDNDKTVTYEVIASKGQQRQTLTFSADCKRVVKSNPPKQDPKKKPDDGTVPPKKEKKPKDPVAPAPTPATQPTTAPAPKK
jgi:hypothetical protein